MQVAAGPDQVAHRPIYRTSRTVPDGNGRYVKKVAARRLKRCVRDLGCSVDKAPVCHHSVPISTEPAPLRSNIGWQGRIGRLL